MEGRKVCERKEILCKNKTSLESWEDQGPVKNYKDGVGRKFPSLSLLCPWTVMTMMALTSTIHHLTRICAFSGQSPPHPFSSNANFRKLVAVYPFLFHLFKKGFIGLHSSHS